MESEKKLRRGDEVELTADSAAFEGGCVAHYDGMAVFLEGCVPGDRVLARVYKTKQRYAQARTIQLLEPSPHRVAPRCRYFSDCGGCRWQDLDYNEQIRWKRQHVVDAFQRIAGLQGVEVRESIGSANEYFYRNKMEFSFGDRRWFMRQELDAPEPPRGDFALGLHVPGRFDRVLDVHECFLQSPQSVAIVNTTREFMIDHNVSIYNTHTHEGLLRNLVIRTSQATGEIMVILVTSDDATEIVDKYARQLAADVPSVTTLVQGINRKKAQIAFSEEIRLLYGSGTITETIAGNKFTISPFSFFQTNSLQAERLFNEVLAAAMPLEGKDVWDLYCGAGTITLAAARLSRRALGIEVNPGSVEDARRSAIANRVENAAFVAGDLKDVIHGVAALDPEIADGLFRPNVVITDPPRAGMHENVVRALLELAPQRIIYVSCNPTTQARDCAILAERYHVEFVQPVDMFPQTWHVETVARLVLRDV